MGKDSAIPWTDNTFNPWIGCAEKSPGCLNCYAKRLDARKLWDEVTHWGPKAPRKRTSDSYWRQPIAWNMTARLQGKRIKVFCASLADVFEDRPEVEPWRQDLWRLIKQTPWLDWLLLTKRLENVVGMVPPAWKLGGWPDYVWMGVTVVNQKEANELLPIMVHIPAFIKFISYEPGLEPVDLYKAFGIKEHSDNGPYTLRQTFEWVIVGGESGPGSRPMYPINARSLLRQCRRAGIPFFFKQWGDYKPDTSELPLWMEAGYDPSKWRGGCILNGREWKEFPTRTRSVASCWTS
jgi:protein gp37